MTEHVLHPRIIENKDWITLVFIMAFGIIALTKSVYENRFEDFVKLIYSNKYIRIYRDSSHLMGMFSISLFFVQIISFSFFIQLLLSYLGYGSKTDWILFIQIFTFLIYFILSKFLIEKIIATTFNIEEFIEQFNLQKVTYRTYIGLLLLPVDIVLFYYDSILENIPLLVFYIILALNGLLYLISIKNYRNEIFSKLFYFILYLCTLEIAPYYFMYYWFTKSSV
ncbi:DUF4271 domain-containing protein [Flavobacterium sp. ZT3R18]|uniref:DUF4271 domain-containing protein n=1 Tax=Flavobacterium sp. ZT3R18 TaxID=2594429 RepID=UPI00117A7BE9|nr:DUF4271 domain-containing protein [Flavobacterium sp. ZT3R18]TRX38494.1 DUF4271 domain-containing protein [Flavobacterium sp. ZT3R18]